MIPASCVGSKVAYIHHEVIYTKNHQTNLVAKVNGDESSITPLFSYRFKRPSGRATQDNDAKWHCYINYFPLKQQVFTESLKEEFTKVQASDISTRCFSTFFSNQVDLAQQKHFFPSNYRYIGKDEPYGRHWDILAKGSLENIDLVNQEIDDSEVYEFNQESISKKKYRHFMIINHKQGNIKMVSAYADCSLFTKSIMECDRKNVW